MGPNFKIAALILLFCTGSTTVSAKPAPWLKNFFQIYPHLLCNGDSKSQQCYDVSRKTCIQNHKKYLKWCVRKKGSPWIKPAKSSKEKLAVAKALGVCAMERFKKTMDRKKIIQVPACENVF